MMRKTARAALLAATLTRPALALPAAATAQVLEIGGRPVAGRARPAYRDRLLDLPDQHDDLRRPDRDRQEPAGDPGAGRVVDDRDRRQDLYLQLAARRHLPRRHAGARPRTSPRRFRRVLQPGDRLAARQPLRRGGEGRRARRRDTSCCSSRSPSAPLLASLATHLRSCRGASRPTRTALQRAPVGTGPFRFQQWAPDTFISLQQAMPATGSRACRGSTGLKFNIVPEAATRQVGISSGTYAMLPNIDPTTALPLDGKPNVNARSRRSSSPTR